MLKSVLIFHLEANSGNNPTLGALAELLQARGVRVRFIPEPAPNDRSGHTPSSRDKRLHRLRVLGFDLLAVLGILPVFVRLKGRHLLEAAREADLLIGVDRPGLLYAATCARLTGRPYGLISFEITFADEISRCLKRPERTASQGVSFWTVQDPIRADLLARENAMITPPFLLPVASAGRPPAPVSRIRDRLGIPAKCKAAILLGNISAYNMPREILRTLRDWPENWVLILNDRYKLDISAYLEEQQDLLNKTLFVNTTPLDSFDDLSALLAGVDAGLVFYQATRENRIVGRNMEHIGMSSGKLSTLLRNGVPVITSLKDVGGRQVEEYKAGVLVDSPADIPAALKDFPEGGMHENARRLFAEKYDFNLFAEDLWHTLETAAASPRPPQAGPRVGGC